jgi:hypothetical protein
MNAMQIRYIATAAAGLLLFSAGAHSADPSERSLRPALVKYLAERGDLCLGKYDWPIGVTGREAMIGTRDAIQMPVLQKVGLVKSSPGSAQRNVDGVVRTLPATRYELTGEGRKFYIARETTQMSADGRKTVRRSDFCAGKLSLDSIVGWDAPKTAGDHIETTVTYTYRIAAARWTRDPDVQKVFPMIDRVVKGEGTMQLKQALRLTRKGWAAVDPWE